MDKKKLIMRLIKAAVLAGATYGGYHMYMGGETKGNIKAGNNRLKFYLRGKHALGDKHQLAGRAELRFRRPGLSMGALSRGYQHSNGVLAVRAKGKMYVHSRPFNAQIAYRGAEIRKK